MYRFAFLFRLLYTDMRWNMQGAFDSDEHEHLPRTKYDLIIDEASNKPGEQSFEVRFSAAQLPAGVDVSIETHIRSLSW